MHRMTGVQILAGAMKGFFYLCHHAKIGSGAHPDSYPMGIWALTPGVKWPGNEDHSPPSSAKVKM